MTRSPTPDRVRLLPCPAGSESINDRLTADSFPVRSRRRTHPRSPHSRPLVARPSPDRPPVKTAACFSRSRPEMPPPGVARSPSPRSCGGGLISALDLEMSPPGAGQSAWPVRCGGGGISALDLRGQCPSASSVRVVRPFVRRPSAGPNPAETRECSRPVREVSR